MRLLILIVIIIIGSHTFAATHNHWKYKGKFIREGDSQGKVYAQWGEPKAVYETEYHTVKNTKSKYKVRKKGEVVLLSTGKLITTNEAEWIYSDKRFNIFIYFSSGKVEKIDVYPKRSF